MIGKPKVEERAEQRYVALRLQATMQELGRAIQEGIGEVASWLARRGIAPMGAPFVRYVVIDMERLLEIEVGFPVAEAQEGDERVVAGMLPAGRYASLIYTGIDRGIEANWELLKWGAAQGLVWDSRKTEKGEAFKARFEVFLTNPEEEPDRAKWETEVAIRLADQPAQ